MFQKLKTILDSPDLRRKLLLTVVLLVVVYRMGFWIPLPVVNQELMQSNLEKLEQGQLGSLGQILQTASLFSASKAGYSTIFGLGIMPYISCSIVFQLLATVYPPLERMQKEGESGRRRINELTRQATVVVSLLQSFGWVKGMSYGTLTGEGSLLADYDSMLFHIATAVMMTSGTMFLMWIGEQIDAFGIGNGISLLIMAGIMAQMPGAVFEMVRPVLERGMAIGSDNGVDRLLLLFALFVAIVLSVIFVTQAQRRIPVQSAKHVRGRRMFGGAEHFLPLKLNQSGVMPIFSVMMRSRAKVMPKIRAISPQQQLNRIKTIRGVSRNWRSNHPGSQSPASSVAGAFGHSVLQSIRDTSGVVLPLLRGIDFLLLVFLGGRDV